MNSSRLPGKVLLKINGRPLISYMYERVLAARSLDGILIATSQESSDDLLYEYCIDNSIPCVRGSLDDVLGRYYHAALKSDADIIVRLTGDCPLIDPMVIDAVVNVFTQSEYQFVANTAPPDHVKYPEGMDVEVFSVSTLKKAYYEAYKPSDREHVTFYFWKNPDRFSCFRCDLEDDLSKYRLTVDYPEDFIVVEAILNALYSNSYIFSMHDIVQFLDINPSINNINSIVEPFSGWRPSLEKDIIEGFFK